MDDPGPKALSSSSTDIDDCQGPSASGHHLGDMEVAGTKNRKPPEIESTLDSSRSRQPEPLTSPETATTATPAAIDSDFDNHDLSEENHPPIDLHKEHNVDYMGDEVVPQLGAHSEMFLTSQPHLQPEIRPKEVEGLPCYTNGKHQLGARPKVCKNTRPRLPLEQRPDVQTHTIGFEDEHPPAVPVRVSCPEVSRNAQANLFLEDRPESLERRSRNADERDQVGHRSEMRMSLLSEMQREQRPHVQEQMSGYADTQHNPLAQLVPFPVESQTAAQTSCSTSDSIIFLFGKCSASDSILRNGFGHTLSQRLSSPGLVKTSYPELLIAQIAQIETQMTAPDATTSSPLLLLAYCLVHVAVMAIDIQLLMLWTLFRY